MFQSIEPPSSEAFSVASVPAPPDSGDITLIVEAPPASSTPTAIRKVREWFTIARVILFSFVAASLIGGGLLMITEPSLRTMGFARGYLAAVFQAVSAVCVTGLTSVDFSAWTLPSQAIIALWIWMGGVGVHTVGVLITILVAARISKRTAFWSFTKDLMGMNGKVRDIKDILFKIVMFTGAIQVGAALIMYVYLNFLANATLHDAAQNTRGGIAWFAIFHAISAFNNAGFSTRQDNLVAFISDPVINGVVSWLIIVGGTFPHIMSGWRIWRGGKLTGLPSSYQNKLVLYITIGLLLFGTGVLLIEPSYANKSLPERIQIAWFHSVSARTAGFNTVDLGTWKVLSLGTTIALMFIGCGPLGTGGGIKQTTAATVLAWFRQWDRKPMKPIELMGQKLSRITVQQALRNTSASLLFCLAGWIIIIIAEEQLNSDITQLKDWVMRITFETISAFGTVGLTMGDTKNVYSLAGSLTAPSQIVLMALMIAGRVSPLIILASITTPESSDPGDAQGQDLNIG